MKPGNEAPVMACEEVPASASDRPAAGHGEDEKPLPRGHAAAPPVDRRRTESNCARSASVTVELPRELCARLSKITRDEPLLHYAALAAAVSACLFRYTRSSPICIGAPAMKLPNDPAASSRVSAIIDQVEGQMTFRQLLLDVREVLLGLEEYSYTPERILAEPGIASNRCPLFDVALVIAGLHPPMPEVRHDITLIFSPRAGMESLQAEFSPDLYEPQTVSRFCHHVLRILQSGLEDISRPVSQLEMLTSEETQMLVTGRNETAFDYPRDRCVHEMFEEHAARSPNQTALVCGDQKLTYRELNERANQLAHYLRRLQITPDTLIGLFLKRSVDQVIGLLGILKAGAAYVPYDTAYPRERLAAMFEDLKPKVVVTSERLTNRLPDPAIQRICLDGEAEAIARESREKPAVHPAPGDLCYVIFTSGSTGRAKAAAVCHGGWNNLLNWFVHCFNIVPADKTLVMSSISFDITQRAMAMPLTSGGELHLVASDHYEPELILNTIANEKITIMNCAPSTFYPLVEGPEAQNGYQRLSSLRYLILGGEAITAARLKRWATSENCHAQIPNVYGAAECSDVSSYYVLRDFDRYIETSVPIGKNIYNTQIYLLDENLQLVPIGVTGEICLAGDGVGKGYINDPALTSRKFPANPFSTGPEKRMYRTGDLARYLPDGNLEFIGRVDNQVKIRGQRVELGEIETVLRQQAGVKEAVVIQSQFGADQQRLVAYVVPAEPQPQDPSAQEEMINTLRDAVTGKLPQYMVPNAFVLLAEMPLNPNGKVDRGSLPQPAAARGGKVADPPRTETERMLVEMFTRTLGAESVGITDNFFNLGGHSLLVTQMLANIGTTFKVDFQAIDFYQNPTIAGIAGHIDAARGVQPGLKVEP
jgi:amino acid adenylation domain-containing protein